MGTAVCLFSLLFCVCGTIFLFYLFISSYIITFSLILSFHPTIFHLPFFKTPFFLSLLFPSQALAHLYSLSNLISLTLSIFLFPFNLLLFLIFLPSSPFPLSSLALLSIFSAVVYIYSSLTLPPLCCLVNSRVSI